MRKTVRGLMAVVAVMMLFSSVAACGGDDDDDEATSTIETSGTPSGQGTPTGTRTGGTPTTTPGSPTAGRTATASASPTSTTSTTPSMAVATQEPTATSEAVLPGEFAYGWNVATRGDDGGADHNERTIQAVQDSGFGWVRFQIEWSQFERQPEQWDPLPSDRIIDQFHAAGINILVVVAKAPDWALDPSGNSFLADYSTFQRFMGFLANRYKGKVQAWEIWNEQNTAGEMRGQVRPGDYIDLLRAGSAGVRAADPNAIIVFGGLTPNGLNDPTLAIDDALYLDLIYSLGGEEFKSWFDVMGVHVSSTNNPPDTMWPDNPGPDGWSDDESFYFRRAEQLRQVMLDHGDDAKPMWITEFGWTTANPAPGYEYGADNSQEDVATYLVRSFEIARTEWDFVTGMFVWTLNWSTLAPPEDEKVAWSALNADWSPRPAYEALAAMPK